MTVNTKTTGHPYLSLFVIILCIICFSFGCPVEETTDAGTDSAVVSDSSVSDSGVVVMDSGSGTDSAVVVSDSGPVSDGG